MKEIGATLKNAREEIGVSLEEVASDLKLRVSQLEDIEAGNLDAFKDVFYLKYFIRDYAKYLGLNYEDMIDEFNEYLFDYTSKISIDDIRKAKKKVKKSQPKEEERKIISPYTLERKKSNSILYILFYAMLMVVVFIVSYFIFATADQNSNESDNDMVAFLNE